jgi:hypothetical protein
MNCETCPYFRTCGQKIHFGGLGIVCPRHPKFSGYEKRKKRDELDVARKGEG